MQIISVEQYNLMSRPCETHSVNNEYSQQFLALTVAHIPHSTVPPTEPEGDDGNAATITVCTSFAGVLVSVILVLFVM